MCPSDGFLAHGLIWGYSRATSVSPGIWPLRCEDRRVKCVLGVNQPVPRSLTKKDERKWARLHLAIPVFVRSRDGSGKDSLEFATAINISPGGALVVVRRSVPQSAVISLEIPSAPIGPTAGLKTSSRVIRGKAVWVTHLDAYHLLGLKFDRPLSTDTAPDSGRHLRKPSAPL